MLREGNIYRWFNQQKQLKRLSILPVLFMVMNVLSPAISLTMFHLFFDGHLVECQHYRQHNKDCQASCILGEMIPEQEEAIPNKSISYLNLFPDLFLRERQFITVPQVQEVLMNSFFTKHLMLYSPPILGMQSPPPKAA